MPRGSGPGERRGGRTVGTPNKATVERQQATTEAIAKSRRAGMTPLDVMQEAMRYCRGLMARYQLGGAEPNPKEFEKYMKLAVDFASKAAPYLHSRLAQIDVRHQSLDLTKLKDAELDQLEQLLIAAAPSDDTADQGGEESTRH